MTQFTFIRKVVVIVVVIAVVIIFQSIVQTCFDYWPLGAETAEEDGHLAQLRVLSSVCTINFLWIPLTRADHFNPALALRTPPLTMQSTSFRGDWWCVYVRAINSINNWILFDSDLKDYNFKQFHRLARFSLTRNKGEQKNGHPICFVVIMRHSSRIVFLVDFWLYTHTDYIHYQLMIKMIAKTQRLML